MSNQFLPPFGTSPQPGSGTQPAFGAPDQTIPRQAHQPGVTPQPGVPAQPASAPQRPGYSTFPAQQHAQPQQAQPPAHQPQAQQAQQAQPQPQQYAPQPYPTDTFGQPQPQPHGAPAAAAPKAPRGGLAALFDFSFTTYATPQIVRIVFLLVTTLLVLAGLGAIGSAFMTDPIAGVFALLLVPLVVIFYLAMIRMSLELVSAVIRISEDVHERLPDARR